MIKANNISPLNTATQLFFHCGTCGAKETMDVSMINVDNPAELEQINREACPYCGHTLGGYSLPKLSGTEIDLLISSLFPKKGNEYPLNFYMHLLLDKDSQHSIPPKFSERIESLNEFLSKSKDMKDQNRTTVGMIFIELLKFLSREGYISQEDYQREYKICMQSVIKHYE